MGLFGKKITTKEFNRDLIQNVAIFMNKAGITSQPILNFLHDDAGICCSYTRVVLQDSEMKKFAGQDFQLYLRIMASHAFGAGVVTTLSQEKFNKPVEEFEQSEIIETLKYIFQNDAYELALNMLQIPINSNHKEALDYIIVSSINAAMKTYGKQLHLDEYLWELNQVFFNMGVTMVLRV